MTRILTYEVCNTSKRQHLEKSIVLILENNSEGLAVLLLPDQNIPTHGSIEKIVSIDDGKTWTLEDGNYHTREFNQQDQAWYFEFVDYDNTGELEDNYTQRYLNDNYDGYIRYNLDNPHVRGESNGSGTGGNTGGN